MVNKLKTKGDIYCAGVYALRDLENGDIKYIGSGIETNDSMSRHLYHLKRDMYNSTNKAPLQEIYDRDALEFEVIHRIAEADEVKKMNYTQKAEIQRQLSILEKEYIKKHDFTIVNCQKKVTKHSSNKSRLSTWKRRSVNMGSSNPNSKYDENILAEILWLKLNHYKPVEISEIYKNIGIGKDYIYSIGLTKWINLQPIKPTWVKEKEAKELAQAN